MLSSVSHETKTRILPYAPEFEDNGNERPHLQMRRGGLDGYIEIIYPA